MPVSWAKWQAILPIWQTDKRGLRPHWFGSLGDGPVELLSLFGRQGERAHVRARPQAG